MRTWMWLGAIVVGAILACQGERGAPARPEQPPAVVEAPPAPPAREPEAAAPHEPAAPAPEAAAVPAAPVEPVAASAPPAPPSLVARVTSPTQIVLAWTPPAADVAGYEVLRGGTVVARESALTRTDGSVRPGHRYCYSVVALDGAGNRSPPSPAACASTPDVAAPTPPAEVSAVAGSDRVVAISWSASTDDGGVAGYEVYRGEERVAATSDARSAQERIASGGRHCYAVEAVDRAGNRSPRSAPACVELPDVTPPSAPTGVVARASGEHEVAVEWTPSTDDVGVAGYELLREGKVLAKASERAASERGLKPWREYCYEVRAFDAAGNVSAAAAPACARTLDLTPPSAPVPVATAVSDHEIAIRWSAAADNVGTVSYEVEGHEATVVRAAELELSQKSLRAARRYCFRVRALDAAGNASERAQACATTPDLTPPTAPGQLAVAPRAATEVAAAWEPSQDEVGVVAYDVLRGEEVVASVSRTSAVVTGLAPEKEHCFTVRARDAAGNRSPVAGPLCATTPDLATPAGPANLRVEIVAEGVQLRWEPSPLADVVYAVYRDAGKRVGTTRAQRYTLAGALADRGGCYRVAAVDDVGRESPRTIPACAPARVAVTTR